MGPELSAERGRCGACTRAGSPCRNHPIRWRRRCRLHGGAKGTGARPGNRNALKHGRATAAALGARRAIMRVVRESKKALEEMSGRE